MWTDPSGKAVSPGTNEGECPPGTISEYQGGGLDPCVPMDPFALTKCIDFLDSLPPLDIGYIMGVGGAAGIGGGATAGFEVVFDLYDFEVATFVYVGPSAVWGASATLYGGLISGWRHYREDQGILNYKGPFVSFGGSFALDTQVFAGIPAPNGETMAGVLVGVGVGADITFQGKPLTIPGNLSSGVPVYHTLDEVTMKLGLGDWHMSAKFHQGGTRNHITQADAHAFTQYLLTMIELGPIVFDMIAIVEYNGNAWERSRKYW